MKCKRRQREDGTKEKLGIIWELLGIIWELLGIIWEALGIIWEALGRVLISQSPPRSSQNPPRDIPATSAKLSLKLREHPPHLRGSA